MAPPQTWLPLEGRFRVEFFLGYRAVSRRAGSFLGGTLGSSVLLWAAISFVQFWRAPLFRSVMLVMLCYVMLRCFVLVCPAVPLCPVPFLCS
eukprot:2209104-Pyramimonas_sp.AAC.1